MARNREIENARARENYGLLRDYGFSSKEARQLRGRGEEVINRVITERVQGNPELAARNAERLERERQQAEEIARIRWDIAHPITVTAQYDTEYPRMGLVNSHRIIEGYLTEDRVREQAEQAQADHPNAYGAYVIIKYTTEDGEELYRRSRIVDATSPSMLADAAAGLCSGYFGDAGFGAIDSIDIVMVGEL